MSHQFSQRVAILLIVFAMTITGVTPALAAPPANDDFSSAIVIGSLPYSHSVDNTEATLELDEPESCSAMPQSVWYSFTPISDIVIGTDMDGSSFSDTTFTIYQAVGPGFGGLSLLDCITFSGLSTLSLQAGTTYYIQAGNLISGSGGDLHLNLQEIPPPSNDDFANATVISALPFNESVNTIPASLEVDEPKPTCDFGNSDKTIWYSFTPTTSGPISVSFSSATFMPVTAAYTGNTLANLTEVECRLANVFTIQTTANTTYYFQVQDLFDNGGTLDINIDVTPPIEADISSPPEASIFDSIQFCSNSFDPGGVGIEFLTWDFGDGATGTDFCEIHQYSADGDYTVQLSVTTFDGRTGSTSKVVQIRTHDVSIAKVAAPKSASVGQTKTINVNIKNNRYPEMVSIELYRSVAGGGFHLIGVLTQFVPVRPGNRTSQFTFNYTFSQQDAQVGKVTFKAIVFIENANDDFPADNEAISTPPTRVGRISYP